MATPAGMKLVFRLCGVGFALSIEGLIEIREKAADLLDRSTAEPDRFHLGDLPFREGTVSVRDLARRLQLRKKEPAKGQSLLVLAGQDGPWGFWVDQIDGICPDPEFEPLDLSPFFFDPRGCPYQHIVLWRDEMLVALEPEMLEDRWELP